MMKRLRRSFLSLFIVASLNAAVVKTQQIADTSFKPPIESPAYQSGTGPTVLIDEAHFNLHTANGRFQTFAELLRRDGYMVKSSSSPFSRQVLRDAQILVIANALAERNGKDDDWSLPTPSAFTNEEIAAIRDWVKEGGALLLIADHMPFPGGAEKLAAAFGVKFSNGFARDPGAPGDPIIFRRADGSLQDHSITRGRNVAERIDEIATFTGSAFKARNDARPLLIFGSTIVSLTPKEAWDFRFDTPRIPVAGWTQGATMRAGRGRVAVFGDATMFAAQLRGPERAPLGMNEPVARQNAQFLLNIAHWLSGLLGK